MHFSSTAVALLAQSVPLLAVGNLAGWKKRGERSWLQRRRLRDALLAGVSDKNGLSFEEQVGVRGKQDNVLEKKRSGSARLAQDDASSEVPSDHGEAPVECDPISKVTDSGIFGCGMDSHCVASEESKLGGLCVAANLAPSIINRALQDGVTTGVTCDEGPNGYGLTCDCSQFNNASGVGSILCSGEYCFGTACATANQNYTVIAGGSYYYEGCYEFGAAAMGVESYCFSVSPSGECEFKANEVACASCGSAQVTCPDNVTGNAFDCTNTILGIQGDTCDGDIIDTLLLVSAETAGPSETGAPSLPGEETTIPASETNVPDFFDSDMPTTAPAPSASPIETVEPDRSSGSSHAAKVTIVVSAAAAAWMASFGT